VVVVPGLRRDGERPTLVVLERGPSSCPASRQHQPYGHRMMSAACTTIDIAKHLVAEHDRREYESAGVAGSRVAEPVDAQGRGGVGEWPVAQQRLVGVGQDHSFGVGVALDFLAELLGPARSASARP
jgi:hypothetical protein